jgi:aromatic-L-amino-acid decarboxylase
MDPAALRAAVAADRAAGRRPFCVVATAGTTNAGAIDPLPELADVAAEEGLWLHVDAAYGGAFQLTARGRQRLVGAERADSLVLDPHKGFFLPFGTGCLLVRDGELLRRAHSSAPADYLQEVPAADLPDFADLGPELTRPARGLRLWLPLHLHGVAAFRATLDAQLDLAEHAAAALAADRNLCVPLTPELSVVVFRCTAAGAAAADEDALTEAVVAAVNAEGRVFLSSTRLDGRYVGRICVLNHRVGVSHVQCAVDAIRRHAAALADRWATGSVDAG